MARVTETGGIATNLERFSGLGSCYDANRPVPPVAILDFLCRQVGMQRPTCVVDLGSGTGLSTRIWALRADTVIGIEPNADMRVQASSYPDSDNIRYLDGTSSQTHLPDGSADIVTCSQSLHWMEPQPTFAEAARILRPGGGFAAFDCDWPPVIQWEVDEAFAAVLLGAQRIERERDTEGAMERWKKDEHLGRIRQSGQFRYTHEACFHSLEHGDANRLVGLSLSQGSVAGLLRLGYSEDELGLTRLREVADRIFQGGSGDWHFTYRLRYGVR
jgi:SAM-dependent methyltransferase